MPTNKTHFFRITEPGEAVEVHQDTHQVISGGKTLKHDELKEEAVGTILKIVFSVTDKSMRPTDFKVVGKAETPDTDPQENSDGWIKVGGTEYFSHFEYCTFSATSAIASKKGSANLLLLGPSGVGKTSRAMSWAVHRSMTGLVVNVALIQETVDLYGTVSAPGGKTKFDLSEFSHVLQQGNVVVLLDELNRAKPWLTNGLLPLLDFRRKVTVMGKDITVGDNAIITASMNTGWGYTGTFEIDTALKNRFGAVCVVDVPPAPIEIKIVQEKAGASETTARVIVRTLTALRNAERGTLADTIDLSPRTALAVAELYEAGMSMKDAFRAAVINHAAAEDRTAVLNVVTSELRKNDQ